MTELIDGILKKTGGKDRSIRWFREKVKELGEIPPQTLIREGIVTTRPTFGTMNFFMYSPKNKDNVDILPYYDRFPLIMPIEQYNNDKLDETTRIRLTWNRIKRNPIVKPTVKRYLMDHVRTPFRRINADEMMVAVLLPVQRFVRATETKVYADSRMSANRRG